ncbi:MAG: hypothetical protein WBQ34_16970 [Candidatus Acidiferrales bacterium]
MRARFFRAILKWAALFFLVLESLGLIASLLGLALKMASDNEASANSWGLLSFESVLRIVIVVFILRAYLYLRRVSHLPLAITRQSALLTTRAAQSILIASVALYALVAEKLAGLDYGKLPFPAWSLGIFALGTVISTVILRRRFLHLANRELLRNSHDARALSQWRKITIVSMVLAMSVGVYGFFLRIMYKTRLAEWLFLLASIGLLFLWRPHLDNATSSSEGQFFACP